MIIEESVLLRMSDLAALKEERAKILTERNVIQSRLDAVNRKIQAAEFLLSTLEQT